MEGSPSVGRKDRHPGDTYEDILNRDTRGAPDYLREGRVPDIGVEPVAASRYFDPDFFRQETVSLWSRVWQWACREEDIPNVGDYQIYEILGKSLIVVRTAPDKIKALHNSCLHRGRKLVTLEGCKQAFKCPFHGMTWNCDGSFKENPIAWDFPHWEGQDMSLPEARVDTWGGFVFVNFDPAAKPLAHYIAPLAEHFERFDYPNRFRAVWVQKKIRANWKATAEAFMESHHSLTTHPQILPGLGDANSQYDLPNDHVSRHFSAMGVASPFLPPTSEQEIFDYMTASSATNARRATGAADGAPKLPEGTTARVCAAELSRQNMTAMTGRDYADATDAEMIDALLYNLFPNMSFWAGFPPNLVYRWRPNGLDPETSIMDVLILSLCPADQPRPKPAPVTQLELDQPWSDAPQLGALVAIFEQDMGNLPYVQEGLRASATGLVHFAQYSELRIRHFHQMINGYLAQGPLPSSAPGP